METRLGWGWEVFGTYRGTEVVGSMNVGFSLIAGPWVPNWELRSL